MSGTSGLLAARGNTSYSETQRRPAYCTISDTYVTWTGSVADTVQDTKQMRQSLWNRFQLSSSHTSSFVNDQQVNYIIPFHLLKQVPMALFTCEHSKGSY